LRLGTSTVLGNRLPRGLAARRALAPRVELVLVDGTDPAHAAAVAAGELGATLVRGEVEAARVHATPLGEGSRSVVLPAEHPAAASEAVRIAPLRVTGTSTSSYRSSVT
jgi:DNA-binding transcriptional LysR family regulator